MRGRYSWWNYSPLEEEFTWRNYELMEVVITEFDEILDEVAENIDRMSKVELISLIGRLRALSAVVVKTLDEGTPEET